MVIGSGEGGYEMHLVCDAFPGSSLELWDDRGLQACLNARPLPACDVEYPRPQQSLED